MTDHDEWRAEVDRMSDAEREDNCGHLSWGATKTCPDCGATVSDQ